MSLKIWELSIQSLVAAELSLNCCCDTHKVMTFAFHANCDDGVYVYRVTCTMKKRRTQMQV